MLLPGVHCCHPPPIALGAMCQTPSEESDNTTPHLPEDQFLHMWPLVHVATFYALLLESSMGVFAWHNQGLMLVL